MTIKSKYTGECNLHNLSTTPEYLVVIHILGAVIYLYNDNFCSSDTENLMQENSAETFLK